MARVGLGFLRCAFEERYRPRSINFVQCLERVVAFFRCEDAIYLLAIKLASWLNAMSPRLA
jgi:hypothetical protein